MDRRVSAFGRSARIASAMLLALAAPVAARVAASDWREIITQRDRARLKNWRVTWVEAVKEARTHGFAPAIDAEGALLQPDAALEHAGPPDGPYRCRTIKLGIQPSPDAAPSPHPFTALAAGRCRIAGGTLTRLDGAQRPGGRLFAYEDTRLLFLGGMALGDEAGPVRYARDPQRALVGFVERVGPLRWRLVLPQPAWESRLDVMELVPSDG